MKIAVFDVCGTLYDSNTTFDFLDNYFRDDKKYMLFRKFSKSLPGKLLNYPFYRFFQYDIIRMIATGFLKGCSKSQLKDATKSFVNEELENKIKKNIHQLLNEYKQKGYAIILMSGSYSMIVEHVSAYVGADGFFASELEVQEDYYTGKYKSDQLFNKKEILFTRYPNITELIVVSDNRTDYELMNAADKGYAICNKSKQVSFWQSKKLSHVEIVG
jgi:HAD superfamily phosphoserine phosphatase-like hydrolase